MNTTPSTRLHPPGADWQILGELELPVAVSTDDAIYAWLEELLCPLALSSDFLTNVTHSAQESTLRVLKNYALEFEHLHLSILVPSLHKLIGKSWGFFHIERIENQKDDPAQQDHAIDFYLYMEGD